MILAAISGLVTTGLFLPAAPAHGAAPYQIAVTFDGTTAPASWLHVEGTGTSPTAALATSGTGTVTRTNWPATIPSYVAGVDGVIVGDKNAGVFPSYASTGTNFAAVKVTPNAFGVNDVLAPGTKNLKFGADIRFNAPLPPARVEDDGNNVVQRGLVGADQYKIQVDKQGNGTYKASCVLRQGGVSGSTTVKNDTSLVAATWYRLLCTRTTTVVAGMAKDFVTLSVQDLTTLTTTSKSVTGARLTDLDYANATTTNPYPLAIGAKVTPSGAIAIDPSSDQFNGRIDNVYVGIDQP